MLTLKPDGKYVSLFYGHYGSGNWSETSSGTIQLFENGGSLSCELFDTCPRSGGGKGHGGDGRLYRPPPTDTFQWGDKGDPYVPSKIASAEGDGSSEGADGGQGSGEDTENG